MTLEAPTFTESVDMDPHKLLSWFEEYVQPFLLKYAPEKLDAIQADIQRLNVLLESGDDITVCFLGNSGVGKSTLLNALVAGECQVLPAGGIGPLTAQATEVRYSEEKQFHVTYHPKENLWKLAFALEARLRLANLGQGKELDEELSELAGNLSKEDRNEALQQARFDQTDLPEEEMSSAKDTSNDYYIKQAKTLVCGEQFADKGLEYLADALRSACDYNLKWEAVIDPDDQVRLDRVREIMNSPDEGRSYKRREGNDPRSFQEDMTSHVAGFLSPLIARIEVGWPSELLKPELLKMGVILVDLPGVGIAQDSYRDVTKSYVRDKARAVILTVDRAGPTEPTMDLLRTSGYWQRLVGAADDLESDTCPMLIAVTRVDDVAQTEWQNKTSNLEPGALKPKKREVFAQLIEEFKPRMKSQVVEQLKRIGDSSNKLVNLARDQARNSIIQSLEIHPVSAPEFRKILVDDEDDYSFLTDIKQTGIPKLQTSLESLARREAALRRSSIEELTQRLARTLISELKLIKAQLGRDQKAHAAEEETLKKLKAELKADLQPLLAEKQEEYRARKASFRNFLDETVPAKIKALVSEAREVAEEEVGKYLSGLRSVHWKTLQAAVRRGGTFYGMRNINLTDDITGYFLEPMAAVWGQKLLREIRCKTAELASDTEQLVGELCELCAWAMKEGETTTENELLQVQQKRISDWAKQINTVGKEAVDELRSTVKTKLSAAIKQPIENACEEFVRTGNNRGVGVRDRILELFEDLAKQATLAAKEPTIRILQDNVTCVRREVQEEMRKIGDPLQDTENIIKLIVNKTPMREFDVQEQSTFLKEIDLAIEAFPGHFS